MRVHPLVRRLSAPFAALLIFGAAGILAMIVALASGPAPVARPLVTPRPAGASPPPTPDAASPTAAPADAATATPIPAPTPEPTPADIAAAAAAERGRHHHGGHASEGD